MRLSLCPLFLLAGACLISAQNTPAPRGAPDPVFARLPFEQWFSADQARIKWSQEIAEPVLSPHQRLATTIRLKIDGADLSRRIGRGQMGMLVQLRDERGALYQTHGAIDLEKLQEGVKANEIEYSQQLFVLPGDYEVSLAILDTATGEHAGARRKLHVGALRNEPLPDAWRDLPPVEFVRAIQPPDAWYLPQNEGLRLSAHAQRPISLDFLVNLTPTERFSGSNEVQGRNLSLLLPALKLLAQTDWGGAPARVSFLDLAHRSVAFDQALEGKGVDWEKARGAFAQLSTGLVDVKTLENRKFNAKFFVDEVGRRVEGPARSDPAAAHPIRVVIILSSPVSFNAGVDRIPIEAEPGDGYRVFYVRYHPFAPTIVRNNPLQTIGRRGVPFGGQEEMTIRPAPPGSQEDHLFPLLKGVRPELFDVENPEQFRRALASILSEIARI